MVVADNSYENVDKQWTRYRLPKASHTFDHMWSTEWPRIRETGHKRFLMDHHGIFYFMGDGTWCTYDEIQVGAKGYAHHEFPDSFNAHWVRLRANKECIATAQFHYG